MHHRGSLADGSTPNRKFSAPFVGSEGSQHSYASGTTEPFTAASTKLNRTISASQRRPSSSFPGEGPSTSGGRTAPALVRGRHAGDGYAEGSEAQLEEKISFQALDVLTMNADTSSRRRSAGPPRRLSVSQRPSSQSGTSLCSAHTSSSPQVQQVLPNPGLSVQDDCHDRSDANCATSRVPYRGIVSSAGFPSPTVSSHISSVGGVRLKQSVDIQMPATALMTAVLTGDFQPFKELTGNDLADSALSPVSARNRAGRADLNVHGQRHKNGFYIRKHMRSVAQTKVSQEEMQSFEATLSKIEADATTVRRKWRSMRANAITLPGLAGGDVGEAGDPGPHEGPLSSGNSDEDDLAGEGDDAQMATSGAGASRADIAGAHKCTIQSWAQLQKLRLENPEVGLTMRKEVAASQARLAAVKATRLSSVARAPARPQLERPGGDHRPEVTLVTDVNPVAPVDWAKGNMAEIDWTGGTSARPETEPSALCTTTEAVMAASAQSPPGDPTVLNGSDEAGDGNVVAVARPTSPDSQSDDVPDEERWAGESDTDRRRGHTVSFELVTAEQRLAALLQHGNGCSIYGIKGGEDTQRSSGLPHRRARRGPSRKQSTSGTDATKNATRRTAPKQIRSTVVSLTDADVASTPDALGSCPLPSVSAEQSPRGIEPINAPNGGDDAQLSPPGEVGIDTPLPFVSQGHATIMVSTDFGSPRNRSVTLPHANSGQRRVTFEPGVGASEVHAREDSLPDPRRDAATRPRRRVTTARKGRAPLPTVVGVGQRSGELLLQEIYENRRCEHHMEFGKAADIKKTCELLSSLYPMREQLLQRDVIDIYDTRHPSDWEALYPVPVPTKEAMPHGKSSRSSTPRKTAAKRGKSTIGAPPRKRIAFSSPEAVMQDHRNQIFDAALAIDDEQRRGARLEYVDVLEMLSKHRIPGSVWPAAERALQHSRRILQETPHRQDFRGFQAIVHDNFELVQLVQWPVQQMLRHLAELFRVSTTEYRDWMASLYQRMSNSYDYEARFRVVERGIKGRILPSEAHIRLVLHCCHHLPPVMERGMYVPSSADNTAGTTTATSDYCLLSGDPPGGGAASMNATVEGGPFCSESAGAEGTVTSALSLGGRRHSFQATQAPAPFPKRNSKMIPVVGEPEYAIRIQAERQIITSSPVPAGNAVQMASHSIAGSGHMPRFAEGSGGATAPTAAKRQVHLYDQTFELHLFNASSMISMVLLRNGQPVAEGTFSALYGNGRKTQLWLPLNGKECKNTKLKMTVELLG